LRVPLHVKFIRPLRLDDPLPSLLAEPLRRRQVGMARAGDVSLRRLCHGQGASQDQGTQNQKNKSNFRHRQFLSEAGAVVNSAVVPTAAKMWAS
jgi:hypothetical protein